MPKIYSLLVGIDEYYDSSHNLNGCVNDINEVNRYLTSSFEKEDLLMKILLNQNATKHNIIKGFNLFASAEDGDQCIFYFSGHGSWCKAPEILCDFVSDGILKTLVCHDSRKQGSVDLLNIELSNLIWNVTLGKDIQFTVITDSCHSGEVTRESEQQFRSSNRSLAPVNIHNSFKDLNLLNNPSIGNNKSANVEIKRGPHIHLAACKSDEKAIECVVKGTMKGVFTHYLIETLREHSSMVTYEDLLKKVRIKVEKTVKRQSPQFYRHPELNRNKNFLSHTFNSGVPTCQLHFDQNFGWVINVGNLNSFIGNNINNKLHITLLNSGDKLTLGQIHTTHSNILGSDKLLLDRAKIYDAAIDFTNSEKIIVSIKSLSEEHSDHVLSYYKESYFFYFNKGKRLTDLEVVTNENIYKIVDHKNMAFKFQTVPIYKKEDINQLFVALDKIAKWKLLLDLEGRRENLFQNELEIKLYNKKKLQIQSPKTLNLDPLVNTEIFFHSSHSSEQSYVFQMEFINNGNRPLWISLLYLSDDYSITNRLMNGYQLNPASSAWVLQANKKGNLTKDITVKMSDELYANGLPKTTEYMKIIISNSEFDTNHFNQGSLISTRQLESPMESKSVDFESEWISKTLSLEIAAPIRHSK